MTQFAYSSKLKVIGLRLSSISNDVIRNRYDLENEHVIVVLRITEFEKRTKTSKMYVSRKNKNKEYAGKAK